MRKPQIIGNFLLTRRCKVTALLILSILPLGLYMLTTDSGISFLVKQSQEPYEEIPPYTPSSIPSGTSPISGSWSQEFFENVSLPENVTLEEVNWLYYLTYEGIVDPEKILFTVYPENPPRYWRITAYDNYTGRVGDSAGKWTQLNKTISPLRYAPSPNPLNYTIVMNINYDTRFTRSLPVLWPEPLILTGSLEIGVDPLQYELLLDNYQGAIFNATFTDSGSTVLKYKVSYVPVNLTKVRLDALPPNPNYIPDEIANVYTSLPPLSQDVYKFANQFAGEGENTFETALIVLRYFQVTFEYDLEMLFGTSTDPGPTQDQDYVEWFIQRGKGLSIHFATAYVVTLRILGIPARMIFGFLPGEENGNSRVIKNKHLHFWAEVWIPTSTTGEGIWIPFDPAPPGYLEALNTERDPYVINPRYTLTLEASQGNVIREIPVNLTATLLSDGEPLPNETIVFTDIYDLQTLNGATSVTNGSGVAILTFNFTNNSIVGFHVIIASWKILSNQTTVVLMGNTTITVSVTPTTVARTESAQISGKLCDAKNGRGLPNQTITIIWGETSFNMSFYVMTRTDGSFSTSFRVPLDHPLGITTVNATYIGYPSLILSSSNVTNATVVANVKFIISVSPNEARWNETVIIEGSLLLDNSTPLPNQTLTIYWDNSTVREGLFVLGVITTDENGSFYGEIIIPMNHSLGFSRVFCSYNSTIKYVKSGNSSKLQILIYEYVDIDVNVSLTRVGRNESIVIFGNMTGRYPDKWNESITIQILFNRTSIGISNVIGPYGQFTATLNVPSQLDVGVYIVRVTISNPPWYKLYPGSGEYSYIIVYGFPTITTTSISPPYLLPGEQLNITGTIRDERDDPVQNAEINAIINGETATNLTSNSQGVFVGSLIIPSWISDPNLTIILFYAETTFYNSSISSVKVFIFENATITLFVNNTNCLEAYPGETLNITGSVVDEHNRYITDRELKLCINETIQHIYLKEGNFTVFYTLPQDTISRNMTIYAVLEAKTEFKSNEVIVLIKVGDQRMWEINIPRYILYIIIASIFAASSTFIFFKKFLKGRKVKRKVPEIDLSSPIMAINRHVRQAKFKEAIIEAYNLFEKILKVYFNVERPNSLTPREFAINIVKEYRLNPDATYLLIKMYEKARFSLHEVGLEDYNSFVKAFSTIYRQITGRALELAQK